MARALIELRQTASQVGRVAFLARHLFQTPGHLPERLGPAGGGVCHQRHRIAHVAEIFRNGDPGVNGRLTGSHRHVRRIGDQDGPLHQRLSGLRIFQFRELVQHVRHLIAPLAAADIDHDVGFRPFRQLVLDHGLAASEGTRHCRHAAFGDREKCIDDALARYKGHLRRKLLLVRTAPADRPFLHQRQLFIAVRRLKNSYCLLYRKFSGSDLPDLSFHPIGHHDLLLHEDRLLHRTDHIARLNLIAGLHRGNERPLQVPLQGRHFHAPLQVAA